MKNAIDMNIEKYSRQNIDINSFKEKAIALERVMLLLKIRNLMKRKT
jgi:hypothetical protein